MHKLALELDDLRVESFDTLSDATAGRGTVLARQGETYDEIACAGATFASCATCESCETCETCTQAICDPTDTADPNRRVILY